MSFLKEFKSFIEKGSAVDMAVGIIVGSVMTGLVNSLVKDVIMPPIGLLISGVDFSQIFFIISPGKSGIYHYGTIAAAHEAGATTLNIGLFMNAFIGFLITMFAVFLLVKIINKMRGQKTAVNRDCPYCFMVVNVAATKCPYCCSDLKPTKSKNNK